MLSFEQDVEFFLRRAERNGELDQHLEALQLYQKAMEVAPGDFRVWQGLSDTYSSLGCNYTAMRSYLDGMWNCEGLPGDYEYRLAHKFIAVEEYGLGMGCFKRFIHDPVSGDFVAERTLAEKLIYLWDETHDSDLASEGIEDLSAWLQVQSGLAQLRDGDEEDGIETLMEAYKSAPENVDIAIVLASSLWPMKRYDEAVEICKVVIELEDDNLRAHCILALIADETGDQAMFKQELRILRSLAYYSPQDIFQAGMSLAELKDYDRAHFLLKEGYTRAPYNVWLCHAYAACSMIVGQKKVAADVYMRAKRLVPQEPTIFYFERKCAQWQDKETDRESLIEAFPMLFTLPKADGERLRSIIAKLANPFIVINMEKEGIDREELPMLLRWGLEKEDGDQQRLALSLALRMDQDKAIPILKSYLALPDKWCKAKLAACDILFCLGVEEPIYSWTEEGKQELKSRFAAAFRADMANEDLPFQRLQRKGRLSERELRMTVYLWQQYLQLNADPPDAKECHALVKGMQMLSQNLCNSGERTLTALRGGRGHMLCRIQHVLEPHFLPVLETMPEEEDEKSQKNQLLFPSMG